MKNRVKVIFETGDHNTRIVRYGCLYFVETLTASHKGTPVWVPIYSTPEYSKALYKALA